MRWEIKGKKKWRWSRLKIPAFAVLMGFVGWRLTGEKWEATSFSFGGPDLAVFPLLISFLLLFVNQYCEWRKWLSAAGQLTNDPIVVRKAFSDGINTGFITPNGWGNFLGRMVRFDKRDRMYIVLASLLASFSQLLPTLIFGSIAALLSPKIPLVPAIIAVAATFVLTMVYFFGEFLLPNKPLRNRNLRHLQQMQQRIGSLRLRLFGWSVFRYLIFSAQYLLLFMSFGYHNWTVLLPGVWLVFLLTSIVPSLWSGKVVIRETAAIFVFANSGIALSHLVAVTLLIWVFNHLVPVLISSFSWLPSLKKNWHAAD